jgi:tetratricopeptide (TPR) repeat protein
MVCYNCGAELTRNDFCTNCGADVAKYKKIMGSANLFYNEGLEKASVRDLSGAIQSLRDCLKLNKAHVEARNLLGLIYFETGEYVAALSEWVISKNLRPKKNIADDYLGMVQNDPASIENISSSIRKYNQALSSCYRGDLDLAVIQLKNVLNNNPNFVKARQLMALIYLNQEKWKEAKRELLRCKEIDTNNTMTLRYLKEAENVLDMDETSLEIKGRRRNPDVVKYKVDNETIIQPVISKRSKASNTVVNILIGIVIGVAAACLLILPARIAAAREGVDESLKAANEQIDAKTAEISKLEQDLNSADATNARLSSQLEMYIGEDGTMTSMDSLLNAVSTYLTNPEETALIAEYLDKIDQATLDQTSDTFGTVYSLLMSRIGGEVGSGYYDSGMKAYQADNYEDAIKDLAKAYAYDNKNGDALFNLGNAYRKMGDTINALDIYSQVIEEFPGGELATRAQQYINELNSD